MFLSRRTTKQLIVWRAGEITLIFILGGVIVVLSSCIQGARRQIEEQRIALEESLGSVGHMTELKEELSSRRRDIDRILAFVPERQNLGEVVGALEQSAERLGLGLLVPEVKEEIKEDEEGNPIEPTGPLREVRLHLVASGPPGATLRWLHMVEYQPYLLAVVSWRFATEEASKARVGVEMPAPAGGAPGSSPRADEAERRMGTLEADVIVSILAERTEE